MNERRDDQPLNGMVISDTAIRQPVLITMLMLLALVFGLLAYSTMPVNLLPEIDVPVVGVQIAYPGAGPESVTDQVVRPIEDELATLSGVRTITSNASQGFAVLIVQFEEDVDAALALQDVRERVTAIRARLPSGINEPVFNRFDPNDAPILTLAIVSRSGQDSETVRRLIDTEVLPRIQRAPGVGSTELTGGLVRQINVQLDLNRMQALRILPAQVTQSIAQANTNIGLGTGRVGEQEFNLRSPSVFETPADVADVGIAGTRYTIADVAQIDEGFAEVERISRLNGVEAITLDIRKQSGTNTIAVAEGAKAEIEAAFALFPDLEYQLIRDDSEVVRENVDGAIEEVIIAIVLAMLVVWAFFRDIRNTLVTVLGLPIIIIATFAALSALGVSINIVSLLALSVSVGLVIDDAIVVRENIFRHMERGEDPRIAASRGTAQVATSVLAMTLTIIVVFVPVAFTSGTTGIIFKSFGLTIAAGMAISIFEAFTLAPMLSAHWFKRKQIHRPTTGDGRPTTDDGQPATDDGRPTTDGAHSAPTAQTPSAAMLEDMHAELGAGERFYARVLRWSLRRRIVMVGIGAVVVVLSVLAAQGLNFSFLPVQESYQFGVSVELPPGAPLEETDRIAREVEQILLSDPATEAVLTTVGAARRERATFFVRIDHSATTPETIERLRPQLVGLPDVAFAQSSFQFGTSTEVVARPLLVRVRGVGDPGELAPVANEIMTALEGVEGLEDLAMSYRPGQPELQYRLIQSRANDYGLTNQDLAGTLRVMVNGDTAAVFRDSGQDYDIVVRLRPEDRSDVAALQSVRLPVGATDVPISSIADVNISTSPTTIRRVNREVEILIGGNNVGRNINLVQADMQARLANVNVPPGVSVSFGGATEDQNEGFTSLLIAMGLSVLFVYMVLASQFGSFLQPLVIMLAMPLSFVGAFLSLSLTRLELDIVAMIGMLLLMGLVVKNSILLVDFTNQLRRAGVDKHTALERAGAVRLRPILMTAITVLGAAVPAAIGWGEGAEIRRPLATVIIGGMITSTLLTLLLVPTAYSLLDAFTTRASRLFRRAETPQPALAVVPSAPPAPVAHERHTNGSTNGEHASEAEQPTREERA